MEECVYPSRSVARAFRAFFEDISRMLASNQDDGLSDFDQIARSLRDLLAERMIVLIWSLKFEIDSAPGSPDRVSMIKEIWDQVHALQERGAKVDLLHNHPSEPDFPDPDIPPSEDDLWELLKFKFTSSAVVTRNGYYLVQRKDDAGLDRRAETIIRDWKVRKNALDALRTGKAGDIHLSQLLTSNAEPEDWQDIQVVCIPILAYYAEKELAYLKLDELGKSHVQWEWRSFNGLFYWDIMKNVYQVRCQAIIESSAIGAGFEDLISNLVQNGRYIPPAISQ